MARSDADIRVGVTVDDSDLKDLDSKLSALSDVDIKANFNNVKKDISDIFSLMTKMFGVSYKVDFDTRYAKRQLSDLQKFASQIQRAMMAGLPVADLVSQANITNKRNMTESLKSVINNAENTRSTFRNAFESLNMPDNFESIDWTRSMSEGIEQARQKMEAFGESNRITFDEITNDTIRWTQSIDNTTDVLRSVSGEAEMVEEVIRKIPQAFEVVEGNANVLDNLINGDHQVTIFNAIQESLNKLGVALDGSESDLKQYIQRVKTVFDSAGNLIGANITSNINGLRLSSNFGLNDYGALAHTGTQSIDNSQSTAIKQLQNEYKQLLKDYERLRTAQRTGSSDIISGISSEIQTRERNIQQLREQINNQETLDRLQREFNNNLTTSRDNDIAKQYTQTISLLEKYQQKINSLRTKDVFDENQIAAYQSEINNLISKIDRLNISYDNATNSFTFNPVNLSDITQDISAIERLNNAINEFQTNSRMSTASYNDYVDNQKIKEAIELLKKLNKQKEELEKAQTSNASDRYIEALREQIVQLEHNLETAESAMTSFGQSVRETSTYQQHASQEANQLNENIERIRTGALNAHNGVTQLSGGFDSLISRGLSMAASFTVFDALQNALYRSIDLVRDLDKEMTSLQMVTEQSDTTISEMMNNYAKMADDLGVTLQTVSEGSAEWLRQGFSAEQTEQLLKASTMLATVGDMDASAATEALTA